MFITLINCTKYYFINCITSYTFSQVFKNLTLTEDELFLLENYTPHPDKRNI